MDNELDINREGDVVLVHHEEKPAFYARIETIGPDVKKEWFQVTLLLLTLPARTVTWILREEYINGAPFTMGGQAMRLEKVRGIKQAREQKKVVTNPEKKGKEKPGKRFKSSRSISVYNLYNRKNANIIYFVQDDENINKTKAMRIALFGIFPTVTYNFEF